MRLIPLVPALILVLAGPLVAQEWIEYVSKTDLFTINFPAQPTVRDITWHTEYNLDIPGHVHAVESGGNRYSVTVVDYSGVQQIHADRVKGCTLYPDQCNNPYVAELRGAVDYATWNFLKKDPKVTYFAYGNTDRIVGRRIQLTNADKTRTFVQMLMHENRLYIFEATVTASSPSPALFQQSVGFIDKNGGRIRYNSIYDNAYPPPTRVEYNPGR
jgi:hypothetical protein